MSQDLDAPFFTLIVPVYNAACTLQKAVDSLLAQSMPSFEILIIDDGSTDGSLDLCQHLAGEDRRIRVISQENRGICAARNRGLTAARGQYVGFCDDDDVYLPDALRAARDLIEQTGADVVRGGYELWREGAFGPVRLPHDPGRACKLDTVPDGEAYLAFLQNSGPQFVWNAFYRRAFLGELSFDGRCRHGLEDFVFNAAVYARCPRAAYDPTPWYRHFERADSTSAAVARAVAGRIESLPLWVQGEYQAAKVYSTPRQWRGVWAARKAECVTFLLHQLRDSRAPAELRRHAWGTLRKAEADLGAMRPALDFLRMAGHNRKKRAALFLYAAHLQGLYACLPNQEERLLR